MDVQICPMCKKEFMPPQDGRSHQFCTIYCMRKHGKYLHKLDREYRKELGLPCKKSITRGATRGYFNSQDSE